ncbi:recombinase RecT [Candidatus Curtissbacteria bacterium]|nr:recombinase RecT [Candidatus Curtissbacteria bacterium]
MDIVAIKAEINSQLKNKETLDSLLAITFKGLTPELAKRAMLEAMMRGFEFKSFLQKDVYALPFKNRKEGTTTYSLVTSVDYARKVGMRSGVVGKSAPTYEEKDGKIVSCTITVKRKVDEYVGDYSATVFFDEYTTGERLWASKPRTMIAKVAEMHALRMACPEELSQTYIEEEHAQEMVKGELVEEKKENAVNEHKAKLEVTTTLEELGNVWADLPAESKTALKELKNELKKKYAQQTAHS